LKVLKRENSRIPEFEEVKEKVRDEVLKEKSMKEAEAAAEQMLGELGTGKPLVEVAPARDLKIEETGLFERGSTYVPKLGPAEGLGKDIFSLSLESPLLQKVVSYGRVFFVVQLKEGEKIDAEKFESEKQQYRKRLYTNKRSQIFSQWLDGLREKSEIKISEENIPF
jgi:hypothetical protein